MDPLDVDCRRSAAIAATGPPFEKETRPPARVGGGTAGILLDAKVNGLGWESNDGPPSVGAAVLTGEDGTEILSARLTRLSTDWFDRLGDGGACCG